GRQGDPGTARFYVSLEDNLIERFGTEKLRSLKQRQGKQENPIQNSSIHREIEHLQRIIGGQNYEIRKTLRGYSTLVEKQRELLQNRRMSVLLGDVDKTLCEIDNTERYCNLISSFGEKAVKKAECQITLYHIDQCWAEHLDFAAHLTEGIHLVGIGGLNPLQEFQKQISKAFFELQHSIEERILLSFRKATINETGIDIDAEDLQGPSATWTYLINDRALSDLHQMLLGQSNSPFAAVAVLTTWPLLVIAALRQWLKKLRK
ncbi:MAG: accessory Sec system translocase SecA2, partial [bacterium]|nr:accessory Sec system translocase SecA2 [bacterium]